MSGCVMCGHDPDARVLARWSFTVDKEITSLNDSARMVGGGKWAYVKHAKTRDEWTAWFKTARVDGGIPIATSKRRVTIERRIGHRQRPYDHDNLAGGCKVVVDAMVRAGLLRDDSRDHAEIHYVQVKLDGAAGVQVTIEELA